MKQFNFDEIISAMPITDMGDGCGLGWDKEHIFCDWNKKYLGIMMICVFKKSPKDRRKK